MIQHEERDALAAELAAAGIQTVVNYPVALPFLPAYRHLGSSVEHFPNAYHNQLRVLSLPMFPEMTSDQQATVVEAIARFG